MIGKRIGSPDYQMTEGVDFARLPKSEPLSDNPTSPGGAVPRPGGTSREKEYRTMPWLEKTFATNATPQTQYVEINGSSRPPVETENLAKRGCST